MLIQKILYPDNEICNETEMFFRGTSADSIHKNSLQLKSNETVLLNTYFNSFPISKWKKYTNLSNLEFHFVADCNCNVQVYHETATIDEKAINELRKINNIIFDEISEKNKKCISTKKNEVSFSVEISQSNNKYHHIVKIPELYNDGLIYVSITAEKNTEISEAGWHTISSEEKINKIKFAIGICTYKREEFLKANVSKILNNILNNKDSCINDKIEVYIADNGQTIPTDYFNSPFVHIYPNLNLGGSAGFTRTIIESMLNDNRKAFSHIILMDDDIVLSTDVLERTYQFLCFLKPEYNKSMLGGAMLLKDKRYIQNENGAFFDGSNQFQQQNYLFDLRNENCVTANLIDNKANYQGWWYCCIPSTIISNNNLPCPFFLHYDDIEYSIRNSKYELILLNGICAWHPSFVNKDSVWTYYYNTRNLLITSTIHGYNKQTMLFCITKAFAARILFHEYVHTKILNKVLSDFLKGAEFFIHQDALALQDQLCLYKYKTITPEELRINIKEYEFYKNSHTLIATVLRQFFSFFLPINNELIICDMNHIINNFGYLYVGKQIYAYDASNNTGILFKKNLKEFLILSFSFIGKFILFCIKFKKIRKDFTENQKNFTNIDFWKRYLKINNQLHINKNN